MHDIIIDEYLHAEQITDQDKLMACVIELEDELDISISDAALVGVSTKTQLTSLVEALLDEKYS